MSTFTPPRMHVVRKEEKEARLTAFVAEQLAAAASDRASREMTVLARSADSPVLRALAAHTDAIRAAGYRIRVIAVLAEGAGESVVKLMDGAATRTGCDARLLDAHEQLAVGDRVSWIGDCMRREPTKRDAYEIYSADCAETAALAHRSFDRLWSFAGLGQPEAVAATPEIAAVAAPVEVPIAALAEGETAPVVSTRH
jgi:hypothetical protein